MRAVLLMLALAMPLPALAGSLIAARTLPAGTVISAMDLRAGNDTASKGISDPSRIIGQETRITIYEGRPIQASLLRAPRLVERNQLVQLLFQRGALRIATNARALDEGGEGDLVRAMNLTSKTTVTARVAADGTLHAAR